METNAQRHQPYSLCLGDEKREEKNKRTKQFLAFLGKHSHERQLIKERVFRITPHLRGTKLPNFSCI